MTARISGMMSTAKVALTGSNIIDGVLSGYAWTNDTIGYAFPDSRGDYRYGGEKDSDFGSVPGRIEQAARFILDRDFGNAANDGFAVEGFTRLGIEKGSDGQSEIRYGESALADPTAYGYYPVGGSKAGDVWFGTRYDFSNARPGNYAFATVIHETGHALGLKHGHEGGSYPALAGRYDNLEYSVMSYRSFRGDDLNGYDNEPTGYPQSFMMADIAALQHMYGADYSVNSGSTVYSWSPGNGRTRVDGAVAIDPFANRIFATIWDGGGAHDRYDLSLYASDLRIDLRPGHSSLFKVSQLADLDGGSASKSRVASGNIYNALLHDDNPASLIEDATGGSGDDQMTGNLGANILSGGAGDDLLRGLAGNDQLVGGSGRDLFVFAGGWGQDEVRDFEDGRDRIDLSDFGFATLAELLALAAEDGGDLVLAFSAGQSLTLENTQLADLDRGDFIL